MSSWLMKFVAYSNLLSVSFILAVPITYPQCYGEYSTVHKIQNALIVYSVVSILFAYLIRRYRSNTDN